MTELALEQGRRESFAGAEDLADLGEDIRSAWVPDVAGGADLAAYLSGELPGQGPIFQLLKVPKADGSTMRIHVLHPGWHAALHRAMADVKARVDAVLSPGVFGYRRGADRSADYSDEWLAFSDYTTRESQAAKWVVLADVASFFPSLSWVRVAESLSEIDSSTGPLLKLAMAFERGGLSHLPPGYADARLLANAVLNLVDKRLRVPIARWVDDYRLFIPDGMDPIDELDNLRQALGDIGLQLNEGKTEVVPASRGEAASKNALTSVYHPDRDPPDTVRENLHRVFYEALDDPIKHRRAVRFLLPRLARECDDIALSFAFHGLNAFPWEAPRLVSYIATFVHRREVNFLVNAHLAAAARSCDSWLVARLGALACRIDVADFAADALAESIESFKGTPAWAISLRVLALSRQVSAADIAGAVGAPDPRGALVALRDLEQSIPEHLRDAEPVLASALATEPAPLPSTDTIL